METPLETVRESLRGHVDARLDTDGVTPLRLPSRVLERMHDAGLERSARATSGVRLALDTTATRIDLDLDLTSVVAERHRSDERTPTVIATVDGTPLSPISLNGAARLIHAPDGSARLEPGEVQTATFVLPPSEDGRPRRVELWLPVDTWATIRALRSDAVLSAAPSPPARRWIHHGSSISHGADVPTPLATWPVLAARALGLDVTNLGVGGQAHVDPFVARLIRDTEADLITVKLGINVINGDSMRERAFRAAVDGFIDTVRDGHPTTPLLVISPISCEMHERTPGPTVVALDGSLSATPAETKTGAGVLTVARIREILRNAVADRSDDSRLGYLDGRDLLGAADESRLYDRLHPDPAGHELIARRFAEIARQHLPSDVLQPAR